MDVRQRDTFNALKRMLSFVTETPLPPPLVNTPPGFAEQVTALRNAISETDRHAIHQGSGIVYKVTRQRQRLRKRLRQFHLKPIREIGKVLEASVAGMPRLVHLPARFANEQHLLSAAKATRRDVEAYHTAFVARGLPSDFLQQLDDIIIELEEIRSSHDKARNKRVAARAGINNSLAAGMDVRRCLSIIIRRCCVDDPEHGAATLRGWIAASRITRRDQTSNEPSGSVPETGTESLPDQNVSQLQAAQKIQEVQKTQGITPESTSLDMITSYTEA